MSQRVCTQSAGRRGLQPSVGKREVTKLSLQIGAGRRRACAFRLVRSTRIGVGDVDRQGETGQISVACFLEDDAVSVVFFPPVRLASFRAGTRWSGQAM